MGCLVEWDEDQITRIVTDVVSRKMGMLAAFRDWSKSDLVSECMIRVRKAWPSFDPDKSKLSTWVNMVAGCRLIDIYRQLDRRRKKDGIAATMYHADEVVGDGPSLKHESDGSLADWLGQVYRAMVFFYTAGGIPVRPKFLAPCYSNRAQRASLILLQMRLKTSCRGLELLLRGRPDLLTAIELDRPCDHNLIHRAKKSVSHLPPISERMMSRLRQANN